MKQFLFVKEEKFKFDGLEEVRDVNLSFLKLEDYDENLRLKNFLLILDLNQNENK